MSARGLSEADVCMKRIDPALAKAGWDLTSHAWTKGVRREVTFTDGRIIVRGKLIARGKSRRADYVLYWKKNLPLAVIEAKDGSHSTGAGMQQALGYAESLDVPFVFSSNCEGFLLHDRTGQSAERETQLPLDAFPSPEALWERHRAYKGLDRSPIGHDQASAIVDAPYHEDLSGKEPRYYQRVAINRTLDAIAAGQDRILLVMATGTGKTYTAFQIIWRLWKSGAKKLCF